MQLAQRLVAEGETVLDVPSQVSTWVRISDRIHGRNNDLTDARTVVVVALRTQGLREVVLDDELIAIRLMSERRTALVRPGARRSTTCISCSWTHPCWC